ncbi:MAG: DUF1538 family protein [Oscillospiraceae bacterium]
MPDIYTAIAFDSGGVASGPMTATFMLQFMMGASIGAGRQCAHATPSALWRWSP